MVIHGTRGTCRLISFLSVTSATFLLGETLDPSFFSATSSKTERLRSAYLSGRTASTGAGSISRYTDNLSKPTSYLKLSQGEIFYLTEIVIMTLYTRWPVAVPPYSQIDVVVVHEVYLSSVKDAWQYLLRNGKGHAADGGIRPEDLILGEYFLGPARSCDVIAHPLRQ